MRMANISETDQVHENKEIFLWKGAIFLLQYLEVNFEQISELKFIVILKTKRFKN